MRSILIILSTICWLEGTLSLIGYDCGGAALNVTTINLLDIDECELEHEKTQNERTFIQLLQLTEYKQAQVLQCKVEIDRTVYRCGQFSHNSVTDGGRKAYLPRTSREACELLHRTGTLTIGTQTHLVEIPTNATTLRDATLAGSLTSDGSCQGQYYNDGYGQWESAVVQAVIKISVYSYTANVKISNNQILLKSGTTCPFGDGQCIDDEGGHTYWTTTPIDECKFDKYDVLYTGYANRINATDSPTVYSLQTDDTTFALMERSRATICGYKIINTEHPRLFIFETDPTEVFKQRSKLAVSNIDIFSYINSKFVYVEKHIRAQTTSLYRDVIEQKCKLEQQVLKNALNLAELSPDSFAFNLMKGPGYFATIAGEVIYIMKCIPVEVEFRKTAECYNDLPVNHQNESMFLRPKSRILVKTGTRRSCNEVVPPMFKVEETWYKFTPRASEAKLPQKLKPLTSMNWKYSNPGPLGSSGIYTEEELQELREHIMFPAEKPALLDTISRGARGETIGTGTINMYNLLDEKTLTRIAESTAKKLFSGFTTFGSIVGGIWGIWAVWALFKFLIDTCIHGYTLHTAYGCSFHLIASLWDSLTHLLMHLSGRKNNQPTTTDAQEQTEQANRIIYHVPSQSVHFPDNLNENSDIELRKLEERAQQRAKDLNLA